VWIQTVEALCRHRQNLCPLAEGEAYLLRTQRAAYARYVALSVLAAKQIKTPPILLSGVR
jgi:hypothetical protein